MNYPRYTQAIAGLGDAFPGSAGPFVTPGTSPYQKSGSAASLDGYVPPDLFDLVDFYNFEMFPVGWKCMDGPVDEDCRIQIEKAQRKKKQRQNLRVASALFGSAAGVAGAYHGYKRNDSVGWAIGWGALGYLFWPIAVPVMIAQGFGRPAQKTVKKNAAKKKSAAKRKKRVLNAW